jgi:hypothetical protein
MPEAEAVEESAPVPLAAPTPEATSEKPETPATKEAEPGQVVSLDAFRRRSPQD